MPDSQDMKKATRISARVYGSQTASHIFSKMAGKAINETELGDMLADAFEFGVEMREAIQQAVIAARTHEGTKQ